MISGLSGSGGSALLQQMRERMMSRLDSDGGGSISRDEFAAGRPNGTSEADAAQRFAAIDADGDGALTATEISSHFQQLAPQTQGALLAAQGMGDGAEGGSGGIGRGRSNPVADLMTKLDADGDGSISKSELETVLRSVSSGSSDDATAAADALFDKLDADGSGAVGGDEVAQALGPRGRHGPPPPPPSGGDSASGDDAFSSLDANGDGVISKAEFEAASGQNGAQGGVGGNTDDAAASLLAALRSARGQQSAGAVRVQMMDLLLKLQGTGATATAA
jgi:Ca2+-binding EF-hand superfamily protein